MVCELLSSIRTDWEGMSDGNEAEDVLGRFEYRLIFAPSSFSSLQYRPSPRPNRRSELYDTPAMMPATAGIISMRASDLYFYYRNENMGPIVLEL